METGLRKDATGNVDPAQDHQQVHAAEFNGKPVFSADLEPAVAANPYLQFTAKVERERHLQVHLDR